MYFAPMAVSSFFSESSDSLTDVESFEAAHLHQAFSHLICQVASIDIQISKVQSWYGHYTLSAETVATSMSNFVPMSNNFRFLRQSMPVPLRWFVAEWWSIVTDFEMGNCWTTLRYGWEWQISQPIAFLLLKSVRKLMMLASNSSGIMLSWSSVSASMPRINVCEHLMNCFSYIDNKQYDLDNRTAIEEYRKFIKMLQCGCQTLNYHSYSL